MGITILNLIEGKEEHYDIPIPKTKMPKIKTKIQSLVIDYIPTDLNTYINIERSNKFAAAKIKSKETETIAWMAKSQLKPIKSKIYLSFIWYLKNKKKDPDNIAFAKKFILDGLKIAGIIENDGLNQIKGFKDDFTIDIKNEHVLVVIKEL